MAMSYIKMFSDSPGIQSYKKYIQIILFYFSAVPKSVPVVAQQTKMAAIDSLNLGRRLSQLIAGESTLQSGACFGTFLRLHFQSSLIEAGVR